MRVTASATAAIGGQPPTWFVGARRRTGAASATAAIGDQPRTCTPFRPSWGAVRFALHGRARRGLRGRSAAAAIIADRCSSWATSRASTRAPEHLST